MRKVVIVDGLRTPFIKSYKNIKDISLLELSVILAKEFIYRSSTFFTNKYSNIAREIAISLEMKNITSFTVSKACATGLQALTRNDVVLCGGVESSQIPISLNFETIKKLKSSKYDFDNIIKNITKLKEYSTDLQMGDYAEIIAKKYNISRKEQNVYTLNSHIKAKKLIEQNILKNKVIEIKNPYTSEIIEKDNNVRFETSLEKLSTLEPVFDKESGTVTPGNSGTLTDGASITLLMSEKKAKKLGLVSKAYIKDFIYIAIDPKEDLLISNTYSIPKILKKSKLKISDKVRTIPKNKLNVYGGLISIGHQFSATALRMINTISNEMERKNYKYGLVSVCAEGGISGSILLERNI
jgi:acetyl-CoA acetyltransferase family protein